MHGRQQSAHAAPNLARQSVIFGVRHKQIQPVLRERQPLEQGFDLLIANAIGELIGGSVFQPMGFVHN